MEQSKTSLKQGRFSVISYLMSIIIGAGIFFACDDVLFNAAGNTLSAVIALIIGGLIMLLTAKGLMELFKSNPEVKSVIGLAEKTVGKKYAISLGWFINIVYYPTITAVLAWLCSKFTLEIFGADSFGSGYAMIIAFMFILFGVILNYFTPQISKIFNLASPIIKIIPIAALAIVGIIVGIVNGNLSSNFSAGSGFNISSVASAIIASAFAYEGWLIVATKASKNRVASKSLFISLALVIAIYVLFYLGLSGYASFQGAGAFYAGQNAAYNEIFGSIGNIIFKVFILLAAFHTLNKMLARCLKGLYNFASYDYSDKLATFKEKDEKTGLAIKSSIVGLLLISISLLYYYFAVIEGSIWKIVSFDSLQLTVVALYAFIIPLFIKDVKVNKAKITTSLVSLVSAGLLIVICIFTYGVKPLVSSQTVLEEKEPVSISVLGQQPIINDGGNEVTVDSGTFKIGDNEYIVDGTAVRLTFDEKVNFINFKNSFGNLNLTPTQIKTNYIIAYYSGGELTEVEYNGNVKFKAKGDLIVTLSKPEEDNSKTCPMAAYLVALGIVMACGLLFNKKGKTPIIEEQE